MNILLLLTSYVLTICVYYMHVYEQHAPVNDLIIYTYNNYNYDYICLYKSFT